MSGIFSIVVGLVLLGISIARILIIRKIMTRRINLMRKINRKTYS
jgi:hypothetical protein